MDKVGNNIIFIPQIGLGKILGIADQTELEYLDKKEYSLTLYYWKLGLTYSIYYENEIFDYLSINTSDIILDNFIFSSLNKSSILYFIEEYHENHKLVLDKKIEYNKITNETLYIWKYWFGYLV